MHFIGYIWVNTNTFKFHTTKSNLLQISIKTISKENNYNQKEDVSAYIRESGMAQDIESLLQTGHIGEYYGARIGHMCELIHGYGVTSVQAGAYLMEIHWWEGLLNQMRLYTCLYNSRYITFFDKNG